MNSNTNSKLPNSHPPTTIQLPANQPIHTQFPKTLPMRRTLPSHNLRITSTTIYENSTTITAKSTSIQLRTNSLRNLSSSIIPWIWPSSWCTAKMWDYLKSIRRLQRSFFSSILRQKRIKSTVLSMKPLPRLSESPFKSYSRSPISYKHKDMNISASLTGKTLLKLWVD